jgi:tRNA A37 threonylcarbamoyladenosine biosynthesis protein TsaE
VNIGWEEILDNTDNICLIEWPELLIWKYSPTIALVITKTEVEDERGVEIELH